MSQMLTVVTFLKSQRRNVLESITKAVGAAREYKPAPSLPGLTQVSQLVVGA
ncbi:hypothetical protein [Nostoc sp. UCD120]|uniref:hypothetical protein n=1 Tax=Nostoc sp. UCD120 TaxID=2681312 RepID=UPI0016288F61|nr:hypothetical protein [Nostoc sp. UCD120]MBC1225450.1 hypothetical protein [Nostoc sp. UCD120]